MFYRTTRTKVCFVLSTNFNTLQRWDKTFMQNYVLKIVDLNYHILTRYYCISKVTYLQSRCPYSISHYNVSYPAFISKRQIHFYVKYCLIRKSVKKRMQIFSYKHLQALDKEQLLLDCLLRPSINESVICR